MCLKKSWQNVLVNQAKFVSLSVLLYLGPQKTELIIACCHNSLFVVFVDLVIPSG